VQAFLFLPCCKAAGSYIVAFSHDEKQALLAVKGVGPTVITRFEEVGIDSFEQLACYEETTIAERVASIQCAREALASK
tara:strand:+ start:193 stop:429 length:237 start_codon:yes stop_codon:yes gene_type:complete